MEISAESGCKSFDVSMTNAVKTAMNNATYVIGSSDKLPLMLSSERVNTDIDQNHVDNPVPFFNHPFVKRTRLFNVILPDLVILLNGSLEELLPFSLGVSRPIVAQKW